jgi:PAS domain S-box-containing protein
VLAAAEQHQPVSSVTSAPATVFHKTFLENQHLWTVIGAMPITATVPVNREDARGFVASIDEGVWDFLQSVPDAMVLSDYNGQIIWVNNNAERMFGYSRDELVGKKVEILLPERFRNVHRNHRTSYYAEPSIGTIGIGRKLSARRKDGVEFPVEISLSPTQIRGRTLVWSALRDISDRERHVAQLREAMQRKRLVLGGLISICSWCKRVHDEGAWLPLETYVKSHSKAKFTHGLCKDCLGKLDLAEHRHEPASHKPNSGEPTLAAGSAQAGPKRKTRRLSSDRF